MEVNATRTAVGDETTAAIAARVTTVLWLIVAIAICLKLLLDIVQQSFFLDGLIYSSIARNLAEGVGTVWAPQFSKTVFPVFAEHPPLMMWLQSFVFRLFGDTVIVDKLFSLATCAASLAVIALTWRRLSGADMDARRATPVVVFFTIVAGRLSWGFANGILENLLIVFTSLAIFFVVAAYDQHRLWCRLGLIAGAGLLTGLALMTKGPVGLFPLAAPGIYWLSFRRPTFLAALVDTIMIGGVILVVFGILWTMEGPREAIERYVSVQLMTSLSGERGHNGAGLAAVRTFARVNAYPLLLTVIVFLIGRMVRRPIAERGPRHDRLRRVLFFSLIGFSASLPLLAGPRVSSFYFNPSLPYFSAALATACAPILWGMLVTLPARLLQVAQWIFAGILGLSLFFVALHIGQPGQHQPTIEIADRVALRVCASASSCSVVVSTCGSVHEDWLLHGYLQRNFHVALDDPSSAPRDYLLASEDCAADVAAYRDVGANVAPYRLLRHGEGSIGASP